MGHGDGLLTFRPEDNSQQRQPCSFLQRWAVGAGIQLSPAPDPAHSRILLPASMSRIQLQINPISSFFSLFAPQRLPRAKRNRVGVDRTSLNPAARSRCVQISRLSSAPNNQPAFLVCFGELDESQSQSEIHMGALRRLGSATLRTARTFRALAPSSKSPAEQEHTADSSLIEPIYMKKYGLEMLELGLRSGVSIALGETSR